MRKQKYSDFNPLQVCEDAKLTINFYIAFGNEK